MGHAGASAPYGAVTECYPRRMNPTLAIRSAAPADLPGVLLLMRHLIPDDQEPDGATASAAWARMLAMPGMTVFLVELSGVAYPVATCTLLVAPNLTRGGRSQGLIENVVTHADHRGKGLGRAVLNAAVVAAWQAGCYRVMLTTGDRSEDKREQVLRFYERAGFARGTKTTFEVRRA